MSAVGDSARSEHLCFAYGSNMDPGQMRDRCTSFVFVSKALLRDHRLCFPRTSKKRGCGVASVEKAKGSDVWGVIYSLSSDNLTRLDRYEGVGSGAYNRTTIEVEVEGDPYKSREVQIYVAVPDDTSTPPSREYMNQIVTGARYRQLPIEYIGRLQAIRTGTDPASSEGSR